VMKAHDFVDISLARLLTRGFLNLQETRHASFHSFQYRQEQARNPKHGKRMIFNSLSLNRTDL